MRSFMCLSAFPGEEERRRIHVSVSEFHVSIRLPMHIDFLQQLPDEEEEEEEERQRHKHMPFSLRP
jgi:hypothetical protein